MALYVRVRGPNGVEQGTVEDGQVVLGSGTRITLLDPDTMQLAEPYDLLTPLGAPRSGAPASPTSARAMRASRRARSKTSTRWSTTRHDRSCS
jgi:hypothetical protein